MKERMHSLKNSKSKKEIMLWGLILSSLGIPLLKGEEKREVKKKKASV